MDCAQVLKIVVGILVTAHQDESVCVVAHLDTVFAVLTHGVSVWSDLLPDIQNSATQLFPPWVIRIQFLHMLLLVHLQKLSGIRHVSSACVAGLCVPLAARPVTVKRRPHAPYIPNKRGGVAADFGFAYRRYKIFNDEV
jgi:hypothetical protein